MEGSRPVSTKLRLLPFLHTQKITDEIMSSCPKSFPGGKGEKGEREREIPLPSQNAKFFSGEISHSPLEIGCQYCTVDKNQGQAIISYHRKLGEQGLPEAISHRF